MTAAVETWNGRARYLLDGFDQPRNGGPSLLAEAEARLTRWRHLVATVPGRALRAAAHQGLHDGAAQRAATEHRRGCLTLSGPAGCGKSVAAAWEAYTLEMPVLWLYAPKIASAPPKQVDEWCDEARRTVCLLVVDDLGAGTSSGDWSSKKVADVISCAGERDARSVLSVNGGKTDFAKAYDGGSLEGRLASRLKGRPNLWVEITRGGGDRREASEDPPALEVLPPRERDAQRVVNEYRRVQEARQAFVIADVDEKAVGAAARRLGYSDWRVLDGASVAADEQRDKLASLVASLKTSINPEGAT